MWTVDPDAVTLVDGTPALIGLVAASGDDLIEWLARRRARLRRRHRLAH
jgi:hypothetical protein